MNTILISNQTVIQWLIPLLRQINNITIHGVTFQCNNSDVITFLHQFSVYDDAANCNDTMYKYSNNYNTILQHLSSLSCLPASKFSTIRQH